MTKNAMKLGFIFQLEAFLRMVAKSVMTSVELNHRSKVVQLDHVKVRDQYIPGSKLWHSSQKSETFCFAFSIQVIQITFLILQSLAGGQSGAPGVPAWWPELAVVQDYRPAGESVPTRGQRTEVRIALERCSGLESVTPVVTVRQKMFQVRFHATEVCTSSPDISVIVN